MCVYSNQLSYFSIPSLKNTKWDIFKSKILPEVGWYQDSKLHSALNPFIN